MRIRILTLFPEMFEGFLTTSIISRAIAKDKINIDCINIRDYSKDKHHHVDDTPFGGGHGMVMQYQPMLDALNDIRTVDSKVLLMSPTGSVFNQKKAREISLLNDIIIICGHYEGIDARIVDHVDEVISIGDYILTGGELASMIVSDAVIRLIDGVITKDSHMDESFENGLLEYPQYTKPAIYNGKSVPDVLLSGHHENIRRFRLKKSLETTYLNRPDLLENRNFSDEEKILMKEIKESIEK
ncbi:MAG: tRNA (guanosine(37)-N1)-methyltransferase TrmD [Anaerorhabdus sp.]